MVKCWHAIAAGILVGVAFGCANKKKDSQAPGQACLTTCEQDECGYVPDPVGDNEEYYECVEACVDKCSK